ncbi:LysR family transcriptional regulator [Streptomyces bambusae]|uniref:LysR family transcriptional regulator n=1 Tax=Streptomyces bambusae TaxID=1550616 RepID=A0ABS6Z3T9_9ACTN|nr:LysR family transcriptional regulator [Streptomyces bambusae]MBW5482251.1 LysR family transcriptional regulator [Streptomyces bambusae]
MELRQLRYFVAVAEKGGFGRAADSLGIVQSAVSTQVRRLERQLGVVLFDRGTRRTVLTGPGEALLPQARAVLEAAHRTRTLAAELADGSAGLLRLGPVRGPGERTNQLLHRLADGTGAFRVVLRHLPAAQRLRCLRDGELDAAFVRGEPTVPPGISLLEAWQDPLYAAVPAGHPLAARPALILAELTELPLRLVERPANPPFHDLVTAMFRAAGIPRPLLGPRFTTLPETLAAIASAREPSWTLFYEVTGLPDFPGIAVRPLAGPTLPTWLAVPEGPPAPALRRLLTALAE